MATRLGSTGQQMTHPRAVGIAVEHVRCNFKLRALEICEEWVFDASRDDVCGDDRVTRRTAVAQATAAAKDWYRSPESGCSSSQVIAIGRSPTWLR